MGDSSSKRTPVQPFLRRTPLSLGSASESQVSPALHEHFTQLYAIQVSQSGVLHADDGQLVGQVSGDGNSYVLKLRVRGAVPAALLVVPATGEAPSCLQLLASAAHASLPISERADSSGAFRVQGTRASESNLQYGSSAYQLDEYVWNHRECLICLPGAAGELASTHAPSSVFTESPSAARNGIASRSGAGGSVIGSGRPSAAPPMFRSSRAPQAAPQSLASSPLFPRALRPDPAREARWADSLTFFDSGSVLATPLVASCCAMIRQYLVGVRRIARPSAALVKALFIDGAADIHGQYRPSESSATEFVKITATIGPAAEGISLLQDEARPLESGDEQSFVVHVAPNTRELRATLVWTDAPGAALQNDLDLIVSLGGHARHGNVAPGSQAFDRAHNVEQVVWSDPTSGEATITVRAFRTLRARQTFALLVRAR